MDKHINSPKYYLNEDLVFLEINKLDKMIDGFPTFSAIIDGETREYFFKDDRKSCVCGQRQIMFGYLPSNNSVNAYCRCCNKKSKLGVKLVKNTNARSNNHLFYVDHQKGLNRFFCECCVVDNVPLNVHHITEVQYGGSDDAVNLQLLCKPCHDIVHALRKAVQRGL
jgi:hypothetical protein